MVTSARTIAQNTTYLTMALIIQKVIAFFFFLMIARRLGGAGTGEYVSAFAFSSFFGVLVDLGLGSVITREIARYPSRSEHYLRATIGAKLFLSVGVFVLLLVAVGILELFNLGHPS
jgi:O-antigen/teichoic acid export membrane protein